MRTTCLCLYTKSFQCHEYGRHVIAPYSITGVSGQQHGQDVFHYFTGLFVYLVLAAHDIYQPLCVGHESLPYAVAPDHHELVIRVHCYLSDVGFAGDHLLAVAQIGGAFVVEIPEGPC